VYFPLPAIITSGNPFNALQKTPQTEKSSRMRAKVKYESVSGCYIVFSGFSTPELSFAQVEILTTTCVTASTAGTT
jgi:hypothetical protein